MPGWFVVAAVACVLAFAALVALSAYRDARRRDGDDL